MQTYESAGVTTYFTDVLALHYKDRRGKQVPLTLDSSLDEVAASGVLRLTRETKAARRTRSNYSRITNSFEAFGAVVGLPINFVWIWGAWLAAHRQWRRYWYLTAPAAAIQPCYLAFLMYYILSRESCRRPHISCRDSPCDFDGVDRDVETCAAWLNNAVDAVSEPAAFLKIIP